MWENLDDSMPASQASYEHDRTDGTTYIVMHPDTRLRIVENATINMGAGWEQDDSEE